MLVFAAAFFGLIITPGPGVLSTAGVGSAYGFRPGVAYIVGLFIGTNITMALVASGVWAMAVSIPWLRDALFWASTAYLLYLALKIGLAGSKVAFIHSETPPGVLGGVMLQLINPKAYVVSSTLFSGFNFMPENLALETALKFAITNVIWVPVHFIWLMAGVKLRELDLDPATQRAINIGMAAAMLGVVAIAALAQA